MKTDLQKSIARTNAVLREKKRLEAVARKQARIEWERANAELELLLDDVIAETGLKPTRENWPLIGLYVARYLRERAARVRQREEREFFGGLDF